MTGTGSKSTLALAAAALVVLVTPSARAQFNSSTVHSEITFSFSGATYTASGLAVDPGDYEFEAPSHYFEFPFVYATGDGTGSLAGSATLGDVSYSYDDDAPDFDGFDFASDDILITHDTFGQSSLPGAHGSAGINSVLNFYLYNYTSNDISGDPEAITLTFDYNYTFDMSLVEGAPGGGEGNGFFELEAEAMLDTGDFSIPNIFQENYGGPASLSGATGSGQISFDIPANNSYITLLVRTNTNSTTLVPVPEPATALLFAFGGVLLLALGRRSAARHR